MTTTARVSQSQRSRPGMINVFILLVLVASGAKPRDLLCCGTAEAVPSQSACTMARQGDFYLRCSTEFRSERFLESRPRVPRNHVNWLPNRLLPGVPDPGPVR